MFVPLCLEKIGYKELSLSLWKKPFFCCVVKIFVSSIFFISYMIILVEMLIMCWGLKDSKVPNFECFFNISWIRQCPLPIIFWSDNTTILLFFYSEQTMVARLSLNDMRNRYIWGHLWMNQKIPRVDLLDRTNDDLILIKVKDVFKGVNSSYYLMFSAFQLLINLINLKFER